MSARQSIAGFILIIGKRAATLNRFHQLCKDAHGMQIPRHQTFECFHDFNSSLFQNRFPFFHTMIRRTYMFSVGHYDWTHVSQFTLKVIKKHISENWDILINWSERKNDGWQYG